MESGTNDSAMLVLDEVSLCAKLTGLDSERIKELSAYAREKDQTLTEVLIERGGVDERTLLAGLCEELALPFLADEPERPLAQVLSAISPSLAIREQVMPLEVKNGRLQVAFWDPLEWRRWDDLVQVLDRPADKVICPRPIIARMLKANYGIGADTVERLVSDRSQEQVQVTGLETTNLSEADAANEPTVVNLVNQILSEAIYAGATDIHFEPYESKYRVRYRIDGMLEDVSIPASVHQLRLALVSRIKIMSNLDITEKRLPQDGRSQVKLMDNDYDLRISILPGVHGEGVVIRIQTRQMVTSDLAMLGYQPQDEEAVRELITRPHGLILVTGPTGSGKTTTLYTCLSMINKPEVKIVTVEDPVEYWMEGILQMQVHEEIGFTFARALRSILRHDPDRMLIGEIRDRETADIAVRAALTGHLVFATLHTNDAASGITRLLDIGLEPFLLASSIQGLVAQRLVRKCCTVCRRAVNLDQLSETEQAMLQPSQDSADLRLYKSKGCEQCRFSGYRGRTAITEVLMITSEVRHLIQMRRSAEQIKELACRNGMSTLRDRGLEAVRTGITDLAEVLRVTREDQ